MNAFARAAAAFVLCVGIALIIALHDPGRPAQRLSAELDLDEHSAHGTQTGRVQRSSAFTGKRVALPPAPRGQSVAQVQDELRQRAARGDAAAASELARDLFTCRWMFEQAAVPQALLRSAKASLRRIVLAIKH
jgi:hypothetical protein